MNKLLLTDNEIITVKKILSYVSRNKIDMIKHLNHTHKTNCKNILANNYDLISEVLTNSVVKRIDDRKRLNIS